MVLTVGVPAAGSDVKLLLLAGGPTKVADMEVPAVLEVVV